MNKIQLEIIESLRVTKKFNDFFEAEDEINRRVDFITSTLKNSLTKTLILGISGGIDSTICGKLCQISINRLKENDNAYKFLAVRLPYGEQKDEKDAQLALDFIKPDKIEIINIKNATDQISSEIKSLENIDDSKKDFVIGNIKARQRMLAQYALAGIYNGLVVGTDHAAEALTGFFTKFGDGACDLAPLSGLTKTQVRQIAAFLKAPENLISKTPTADLETLRPGLADEESLGITYNQIDSFLNGEEVENKIFQKILNQYNKTKHKRELPLTPK